MFSPIAWKDFGWYHVESLPSFHCIIKHFVVSKNQNRRHVPNTGKYLLKKHIAFVAWRLFFLRCRLTITFPLSSDVFIPINGFEFHVGIHRFSKQRLFFYFFYFQLFVNHERTTMSSVLIFLKHIFYCDMLAFHKIKISLDSGKKGREESQQKTITKHQLSYSPSPNFALRIIPYLTIFAIWFTSRQARDDKTILIMDFSTRTVAFNIIGLVPRNQD